MSQETELIKERIDLADLIGEYVPLKKAGTSFKGLCPFHNEKSPSFVVTPEKKIWHCFGCGEGGDHFSFVEKIEGTSFREVLQMLAERAGVELPQYNAAEAAAASDHRSRLYDLQSLAAKFYHEILVNQKAGAKAKEYILARGLSEESLEKFQVGYAPNQWDGLQKFLSAKGFSIEEMIETGLVGKSERGTFFDRFRGRVMFPIQDVQGRVVAFGGRILPEHETGNEGKYVNSPETSLYQKRQIIYNFNRAKQEIRQATIGIVVEGYLDVIMLDQIGIKNVVASSGTAFTPEQIKQLQPLVKELHFSFDADAAGVKAALAATQSTLAAGLRAQVLSWPAGNDPADLAQADAELAKAVVAEPISLVALLLQRLSSAQQEDKEDILRQVLPVLNQVKNPVQQGELIQEVATALSIPESVIIEQLSHQEQQAEDILEENPAAKSLNLSAEKLLLGVCLLTEDGKEALAQLSLEAWSDQETARVAADYLADKPIADQPVVLALTVLVEDFLTQSKQSPQQVKEELINKIKRQELQAKLQKLQNTLGTSQEDQKEGILKEVSAVANELAALS